MKKANRRWHLFLAPLLILFLITPSQAALEAAAKQANAITPASILAGRQGKITQPVVQKIVSSSKSNLLYSPGGEEATAMVGPPASINAVAGATSVTISWSAAPDASGYFLRRFNPANGTFEIIAQTTALSYTDENVQPSQTYRYHVVAYQIVGGVTHYAPTSDEVSVTTPLVSGPTTISAYTVGRNAVTIHWDMGQNADGYVLRRSLSPSGPFENILVTGNRYYTDTGLAAETAYYYDIIAYKVYNDQLWFAPALCQGNAQTSNSLASYSTAGFNVNRVVGLDTYWNRVLTPIGGYQSNRAVGIFYSPWFGQYSFTMNGIYDNEKILAQSGGHNKLFYQNTPDSPANEAHYWGEPLYGYYNSRDPYIIRKHIELLTTAGIDFLLIDATNAWSYTSVIRDIMQIMDEMQREGWNTPKIVYYTHSHSLDTVRTIYNEIYARGLYPNTWYMQNGKPMIVAYTSVADDIAEARGRGDTSYNPAPLSSNILNFFSFKYPQWPTDPVYANGVPWIEWTYPQPMHGTTMNVAVASHPLLPFSFSLTRGYNNWGRGWSVTEKANNYFWANYGRFFQSQWDTVLNASTKPQTVIVTGWNEWVASKSWYDGEYAFVDLVNMEYSRDVEMMKGGYADSFYQQLIRNVRAYKGTAAGATGFISKTIDINGSASQWDNVNAIFRDIGAAGYGRNYANAAYTANYTQAAPRNNIQEIRVTKDSNYIYFYIRCQNSITSPAGTKWMNIFIGTGTPSNTKGWQGYEYVVNRTATATTGSIQQLTATNYASTQTGTANLKISGSVLQVRLPRSAIGLSGNNTFYFKVADNVNAEQDIMDYYVAGSSLPMGRLSFQYND